MAQALTYGRYQLLERVAAGGMGEVWLGLQTGIGHFERPVAIKLLLPHLIDDERLVKMFLQEARLGAQLSHANVVQVYDVGFEHDRYFIVMELVRGVSLSKLIAGLRGAGQRLPAELLAFIGRALCDGLHVAHESRGPDGKLLHFVHRDVTPHNVLVSVDGAVKLTDFGIARVAEGDKLSKPGVVLGKLAYLPPEQLLGQPVDARADVFSAGATLFHLAALEKPFDSATGSALDPMRLPQVPLRVQRPDLPKDLCDVIERAMRPDVKERFASAKDFRNALPVPGPDAGEQLGVLLRKVCSAALLELEVKTERAAHTRQTADVALPSRPPEPRVEPSLSASLPPIKDRRGPVALGVLGVLVLAGVVVAVQRPETRPPVVDPAAVAVDAGAVVPVAMAAAGDAGPVTPPDARPLPPVVDAGVPLAPRTPGSLALEATPWAEVTLDGRPIGETPLANVSVSAGAHTLLFRNPETGKQVKRTVQVQPGQRVSLRVDLR